MSCNNPVWRHNSKGSLVPTPCGMCQGCRIQKVTEFKNRFQLDLREYDFVGSFITLTYSNDNLPFLLPIGSSISGTYFKGINHSATLYKPDLMNFLDNLNHKVKRRFNLPIKYIACGEYGDDNKRPHYHACILGLPSSERKLVYDTWNKGRIDIKPINNGAVRYVVGYIHRQVKCFDNLYDFWGDYQPEFGLFSKGLGTLHYKSHSDDYDIFGRFKLVGNGDKFYELNNYYKKKFGFINDKHFDSSLKKRADKNNLHYFSQQQHENWLNERKFIQESRSKHLPVHNTLNSIPEY